MADAVNHQGGPIENPFTFETSTNWNQVQVHDLSELLKRVLQELPEVQKKVIKLASKGVSQREIAAKNKISLETRKTRSLA